MYHTVNHAFTYAKYKYEKVHSKSIKVKITPEQAMKTRREAELRLYSFFNLGTRWELDGYRHAPASLHPPPPSHPPERDPVPNVQEAGWASGPVWTGAENPLQLTIDPRTVQSVASRYTNCAIPAQDRRRVES
jgi:hypothetical protein